MAHLPRTVKSCHKWTKNELDAYNIRVVEEPAEVFFGRQLPDVNELDVDPDVFIPFNEDGSTTRRANEYLVQSFLRYLSVTERFSSKSHVNLYVQDLLRVLNFDFDDKEDVLVMAHAPLKFFTCGHTYRARSDVCLESLDGMKYFLVQEEKSFYPRGGAQAQLIAKATAAIECNNRTRNMMQLPDKYMTMPAMLMVGTNMIFYKIPVSETLARAVEIGMYPAQETVVKKCTPVVNFQSMQDVATRKIIMQHCVLLRDAVRDFMHDVST